MTRPVFCTYFDRNFIAQGLALSRSMYSHTPDARLWVLCLDDYTHGIMSRLAEPNVDLLTVEELISHAPTLRGALEDRPRVEFYYACTPRLTQHVFDTAPDAEGVIYLDADMYFFDDVLRIYSGREEANVLVVEHRSGNVRNELEHGRFNVSIVAFRRNEPALECLRWWADATLESTRLGDGVWGDQKYLDEFPERFPGVAPIDDAAVTLAPWNLWRHDVTRQEGVVHVDGRPLGVYHFARFLPLHPNLFMPIRRLWIPRTVLEIVYRPYMRAIRDAYASVHAIDPNYRVGYTTRNLRGVILGILSGRTFYEGRHGLHRLGVYLPSGRDEWQSRRMTPAPRGQA